MGLREDLIASFRYNFPKTWSKVHYRKLFHKKLNIKSPETFNEKINWMKWNYCPQNETEVKCTDKYAVREYVEKKGLGDILNPIYGVWSSVDDIDWNSLPESFAIKCTHGCAMNIICEDKGRLDIEDAKKKLAKWMKQDFGRMRAQPHYSKITPSIICEKYIEGENGCFPEDYKVHCFNGKPEVIAVYSGRGSKLCCTYYDTEWNELELGREPGCREAAPECLDRLLEAASILSADFPYVRADFYIDKDKIIFGELTFTPGNGFSRIFSDEGDRIMGRKLDISGLMNRI